MATKANEQSVLEEDVKKAIAEAEKAKAEAEAEKEKAIAEAEKIKAEAEAALKEAEAIREAVKKTESANKQTPNANSKKQKDLVTIRLFKDAKDYKDDLVVGVNGKIYQIQRGVEVEVPRHVAEVIERSQETDEKTASIIAGLVKKAESAKELN